MSKEIKKVKEEVEVVVSIERTVQVKQFEPVKIFHSAKRIVPVDQEEAVREEMYLILKEEVNCDMDDYLDK